MSRTRWFGRIYRAPIVAVVAVLLAAMPAAAQGGDPTYGPHSGNYGVHGFIDSAEWPGGLCTYDAGTGLLKKIKVWSPIVYAFDRTGGTDHQTVGIRTRVEFNPADNPQK